jgi:hypothetical protein
MKKRKKKIMEVGGQGGVLTTIVLFTNTKKIGCFQDPKLFETELRMADQVKYLRVFLN